jgi:hypothetical protein
VHRLVFLDCLGKDVMRVQVGGLRWFSCSMKSNGRNDRTVFPSRIQPTNPEEIGRDILPLRRADVEKVAGQQNDFRSQTVLPAKEWEPRYGLMSHPL